MPVKIDLHVHSALSACCDAENTVSNIVNMSSILNNQIIALADHNSAGNVRAATELAEKNGILVVPAMEVTTAEEIHVLCLFRTIVDAESFSKEIYDSIPRYKLNLDFYNPQVLFDSDDNKIGQIDFLLNVAVKYDLYGLIEKIKSMGGIPIPAHIDRESTSLMSVLGYVPDDMGVCTVEVSPMCPKEILDDVKTRFNVITSSDAHSLEQMCSSECYIELPEISINALFEKLSNKL